MVFNSLQPHGLWRTRLCSWDFPGSDTGEGCHFLLWGIFLTQELNLCLLDCRQILYLLSLILFTAYVSFYHAFHSDLHWSWNKKNRKFNRRWMPVRDSQQFRPIKEASLKNNYFGSSLHCSGWVLSCSVSTLSSCSVESSLVERGLQSSWASVAVALG